MLTVRVPGGSDILLRTPPLLSELIRCQSQHGDYACSHDGVAMSGGDGMNSNTRVPIARQEPSGGVTRCPGPSWVGVRERMGR
jgi:hypothetical protein